MVNVVIPFTGYFINRKESRFSNLDAGLFTHLSYDRVFSAFTELDPASRKKPIATKRSAFLMDKENRVVRTFDCRKYATQHASKTVRSIYLGFTQVSLYLLLNVYR